MTDVRSVSAAWQIPTVDDNIPNAGTEVRLREGQRVQETNGAAAESAGEQASSAAAPDVPRSPGLGDPLNKSVTLLNFKGGQAGSPATAQKANGSAALSDPAPASRADIQKKMDDYFDRSNNEYTLPDGSKVRTPSHFQMNFQSYEGDSSAKAEAKMNHLLQPKDPSFQRDIHMVAYGRATPEQIQRVTQALIDKGALTTLKQGWEQKGEAAFKGKYPNTAWPVSDADAVKLLQWSMGAGVDCAGYAQQEFLAVHGGSRADYGFQGLSDENLADLKSNRHFQQVGPAAAEPGDLLILHAPANGLQIGHAVMVQDRHELADAERANYPGIGKFAKPGDKVQVVTVEGSFGPGGRGEPAMGGVQRRAFFYNETTKQWADMRPDRNGTSDSSVHVSNASGPYDHPLDGIYRPKGS
jgi:hypothetical protein